MSEVVDTIKPIFDAQGDAFVTALLEASNTEAARKFGPEVFTDVQEGCSYCMDDRPVKGIVTQQDGQRVFTPVMPEQLSEKELLKPAFVGGAAGWAVMFMMMGKSFSESFAHTADMYQNLGWGRLEAHIDDEHGQLNDADALAMREAGCGFLGVWPQAADLVRQVLGEDLISEIAQEDKKSGAEFLNQVLAHDGTVAVMEGIHEATANVVVNLDPTKTLNRTEIFGEKPAFAYDAGAMTDAPVLEEFNKLSGKNLTAEQFLKIQAALHVVTGFLLNVFTPENISQKLVIVPQPAR